MSQTDPPQQKKSPRRTAPRRSSTAASLQSLKRRLQTLRDYRDRTLMQRAGDVELSLESIIFDAMMARPAAGGDAGGGDSEAIQQSLEHIQAALDQLAQPLAPAAETVDPQAHAAIVHQLQGLREEHESLLRFAEGFNAEPPPAAPEGAGESERLRQQVEVLQGQLLKERQTVVELRLRVDDLNASIADRGKDKPPPIKTALSWDEQKALLLAQLEGEDEGQAYDPKQRLEVEQVIARTQTEIDRRDAEIVELRRLLTEQATAGSSVAIGAAAVAELLDHDDLIKEERDNLRRLQDQFQKKLREAEVELSIERAKIARQRTELDELRHSLQRQQEAAPPRGEESSGKGSSRWLARLGLSEVPEAEGGG